MSDHTKIEWTDATWNPITGCSVVSPGCTNCYAQRLAGTRLRHHPSRSGLTADSNAGPVWTGEVRLNEQWMDQPLLWRKPRRVFVCAHGDLFHERVPVDWIDRVFRVISGAPQHVFQVLTKRPARMREYFSQDRGRNWPAAHVQIGVSAEDQRRADERVSILREIPAAVRFVSFEPLLGPVDDIDLSGVAWVIVGGESGPGARHMNPDWARSLRDQCALSGAAFFLKQMARKAPIPADLMVRQMPAAAA